MGQTIHARNRTLWFTKEQWRKVARRVRPDLDDATFERLWREWQAQRRRGVPN